MNIIEETLSRKLEELDQTFDFSGSDRRILQVANQDFANYSKYNLFPYRAGEANSNILEKTDWSIEEKAELGSLLKVWTGMWLEKWRSRVRLLLENRSKDKACKASETLSKADPLWRELKCRDEMIEVVVSALIKNGEICGTNILAEHLLKMELARKPNLDVDCLEQLIIVLNEALRRTREVAQNSGPLILVKVDKGYFTRKIAKKNTEYEVKHTLGPV